jgi:hypothetical protein
MSGARPRARLLVPALVAWSLVGGRLDAHEPLLASLDYQVDASIEGCPSRAEFQAGVARELGYDPFRDAAPRRVVVRLHAAGGRIDGWVEWRGASDEWEGERGFSSRRESCAQISRAMALATAIQMQLLAGAERAAPAAAAPPVTQTPAPEPRPETVQTVVTEPAAAAQESRLGVDIGAGVLADLGDAPATLVPRLAISVGRPSGIGARLAASGFGPEAELDRAGGGGRIDRLLVTLCLIHYFRADHAVQPLVAAGAGWHRLHARGFSTTAGVAAHEGEVSSGLVTASGGVAFVVDRRIAVVAEAEALVFWPSVRVQIGSAEAAHFGAVTLFVHAGLLARF